MKRIVMVHTPDETRIDPDFCPHLSVVSGWLNGEITDQCLDCGDFHREDGTWGAMELPADDRDYPDQFEVPEEYDNSDMLGFLG
jgi:hypothetical protein